MADRARHVGQRGFPFVIGVLSLALALAILAPGVAGGQTTHALWRGTDAPVGRRESKTVRARQAIEIDASLLTDAQAGRLTLPLPDGTSLVARRLRVEQPKADVVVWFGRVEGDTLSSVILSVVRGAAFGSIHTSDGRVYRVAVATAGGQVIEDVDAAGVPDERDPDTTTVIDSTAVPPVSCVTDDPTRIDVMVVYTGEARLGAGGPDAMEAMVHVAVGQANQSYIDSDVKQRLDLVYIGEVAYSETGDVGPPLAALDDDHDGALDDVPILRDRYGADVVAVIIERDVNECGYSNIMESVSPSFENQAFAVVVRDCATSAYTFAHELGHVMAGRHEWEDDADTNQPYAYNHAYVKVDTSTTPPTAWRTVMGVRTECESSGVADADCVRLLRWSNPDQSWEGSAMGVRSGSRQSDNASTLDNTAATVAGFRCASPGRSDTWMKDAWADTGEEPEPLLAGQPMWKSPYIWVRRVADPDHVHAHEHQNPWALTTNWIYVKLHNGTEGASGTLEIYVASASTELTWSTDWRLVSTQTVTGLGAGETRIVEAAWIPVRGGHYCLLARWSSAGDPMARTEGPDIGTNVRANNNLVWRNVNILDLSSARSLVAGLSLHNPANAGKEFSLELRPERAVDDSTAPPAGAITLRLGRRLLAAWSQAGARGRGFVRRGDLLELDDPRGAVIEGIPLAPNARVPIEVAVRRGAGALPRRHPGRFDVVQTEATANGPRIVGGVSYEVWTVAPDR